MKKNKTEVLRCETSDKTCYICDGIGKIENKVECKTCEGTGVFTDNHYIIITEDVKGNKIAFNMDTIK